MRHSTRTRLEWIGKPQRCNPLPKAEQFIKMATHIANRYGAYTEKCLVRDSERFSVAMLGLAKALKKYRHKRATKPTSTSTFIFRGIMNELGMYKKLTMAQKRIIESEVFSLSNMGIVEKGDYPIRDHREGHEERLEENEYAALIVSRVESVVPERWMQILKEHVIEGLSYTEVGRRHGIKRSHTQYIVENAKRWARERFPELCQ